MLSPWRGLCKYCLTDYTWWAFQNVTEIEAEDALIGISWRHEMPINASSSEQPSGQMRQGQQRRSTLDNSVVRQLQGWLRLPFTGDCRAGRGLIHTERKAAETSFPPNESVLQGSSKASLLFSAFHWSRATHHTCRNPVKKCIRSSNTTKKTLGQDAISYKSKWFLCSAYNSPSMGPDNEDFSSSSYCSMPKRVIFKNLRYI